MSRNDALWADRLLVDVRTHADPTADDTARNLARLERRLQLPAPDGAAASTTGPGASAAALLQLRSAATPPAAASLAAATSGWKSAAWLGRWLTFGATTALLGYLGGRAVSQRELAELAQQHAQTLELEHDRQRLLQRQLEQVQVLAAPLPVPPSPGQTRAMPSHEPEPPARRAPRAARSAPPAPAQVAKPPAPNQQLREAIELLRRVEAELREGDAFAASLLLSDLDRTVPPALLREERLATQSLVACALGKAQLAREALHELEQLNPESIYRTRLAGSCADKTHDGTSKDPGSPH